MMPWYSDSSSSSSQAVDDDEGASSRGSRIWRIWRWRQQSGAEDERRCCAAHTRGGKRALGVWVCVECVPVRVLFECVISEAEGRKVPWWRLAVEACGKPGEPGTSPVQSLRAGGLGALPERGWQGASRAGTVGRWLHRLHNSCRIYAAIGCPRGTQRRRRRRVPI
jgi:hypothetical protein